MNNRARIIGLAVACVAGTSGAAFAGMSTDNQQDAQPEIESATTVAGTPSSVAADGTVTYQVGTAGTVAVSRSAGSLSVQGATAGAGWSVVNISGPGGHIEVQFSDNVQLVTFSADAVGDDIAVAVGNVDAAGATTSTVVAEPIEVVVIETEGPGTTQAPAPLPATPAQQSTSPATAQPTPPHTAAPSSGGEDENDDEYEYESDDHDDEYEYESEDHEDEYEGDDD